MGKISLILLRFVHRDSVSMLPLNLMMTSVTEHNIWATVDSGLNTVSREAPYLSVL